MTNNLVRDPSGIPSDTRRIKGDGAVISLAFGVGIVVVVVAVVDEVNDVDVGALLVDLRSGDFGPDEQASIVRSDILQCADAKALIATCRLVVILGIGKSIPFPIGQGESGANSIHENGRGL